MPQTTTSNTTTSVATPQVTPQATPTAFTLNSDKAIRLINTFDGNRSKLHNFIDSVDFVFLKFDRNEIDIFPFIVKSRLEGPALSFIGSREFYSWDEIKIALLEQYGEILDIHCLNFELCHFKQNLNEKPITFIERVENQLIRIHKVIKYDTKLNVTEKNCLTTFHNKSALLTAVTGLKDPLSQTLRSLKPNSLIEVKQFIIDYENQQFFKQTNTQFSKLNIQNSASAKSTGSQPMTTRPIQQNPPIKLTIPKCRICNKFGHKAENCFRKLESQINVNYTNNTEFDNNYNENEEIEVELDPHFLYENPAVTSDPPTLQFSK